MDAERTHPVDDKQDYKTRLSIAPAWKDPNTGALYVHRDLELRQEAWAEIEYIPPMVVEERFGDVESFAAYVKRYGVANDVSSLVTWNARGLRAVLDYMGRRKWVAVYPFEFSIQWRAWMQFANGSAWSQKQAVEKVEDLAVDIQEPPPTDLMGLLRSLRATVNAQAEAELRPDGTTSVAFTKDAKVATSGLLSLPASFTVAIPVMKGHVNSEGRPVLYSFQVRLRVSVDDSARLLLRFTVPNAERILEDVYADRVLAAKALLGDSFPLMRGAD